MTDDPEPYGSTDVVLTRTGAEPVDFGFDEADGDDSPQDQLEAFVDGLRERASSEVDRFCGRRFRKFEDHVDVRRGNGTDTIATNNYPVLKVHEITVGGRSLAEDAYRVDDSPGMPRENAGEIRRVDRVRRWPRGREIEITYDWGYDEPPGVVDSVVEDAVVEVLEKAHVDRSSDRKQSESMDGYSVTWDVSDAQDMVALTETMRDRLKPLRRRGVA